MLSGAQSLLLSNGWLLITRIRRTFTIWVLPPGRSFADNAAGKGDLSDNLNAAAPSCWKSDQDALSISSVSEMYPTSVICLFWVRDSFSVARRFSQLCHISKSREPWPFCAISFPPPHSSFLSRFLCSWYPILGQCLPKSRSAHEQTALQQLFPKGSRLWFWLPPADNISAKGKSGFHSDTMKYDREYVARNIGEISVLWVRFLLLVPPIGYVRLPKCTANIHWVRVVIIEIWIDLSPVLCCVRRRIHIEPGSGQ